METPLEQAHRAVLEARYETDRWLNEVERLRRGLNLITQVSPFFGGAKAAHIARCLLASGPFK